jgi:phosphoglycolate phosphatase-like HAD superfamily hydrolase
MRLVIFDVDGTLTQTMNADEQCFVRSLAKVCGFRGVDTDWSRYKHATDAGVLHEIYETRIGRFPSALTISQFREHFVGLLARASSKAPFAAVTGANVLLSRLAYSAEHRVALATGGWRDSARLKMASAGLRYDDYPAASSDDALDRESIIRLSMQRAADRYGAFGSAVYVGNGVWDARASRRVGIPFIGVATDGQAARLTAEGAARVFPDFRDTDLFLSSVYESTNAAQPFAAANPASRSGCNPRVPQPGWLSLGR